MVLSRTKHPRSSHDRADWRGQWGSERKKMGGRENITDATQEEREVQIMGAPSCQRRDKMGHKKTSEREMKGS